MSSKPTKPNTNTNLGTRITVPQNPVFRFKRPRNNNGTNGRRVSNLGTRITVPQNPVFRFKRPRNNNGTNGRRVSNKYENTHVKYRTNTPRPNNTNNTINNNQKNVTKNNSTKPRTNTPRPNNTNNTINNNKKNVTRNNVIKMFNNKSQCISNNKTKNVCKALKHISDSVLVPKISIERLEIPFNKLNERTSSIIETIKNASIEFNKKEINLIARDKDFNIDFLFLVYLDIVHDETYTGSFNQFLESDITKILCKKEVPKFKVTTMIGNIIKESKNTIKNKNNIIEAKKGFEKILKQKLNEIFDPKWVKQDVSSTSITKNNNRLNVILDSEKSQTTTKSGGSGNQISALIESSKIGKTRFLKPLITLGSLFDQGKNMLQWGITRDIPNLFAKKPKTSLKWCLYTMNFNINDNTHISVSRNDKKDNKKDDKKDNKEHVLKINDKDITIGLSKSKVLQNKKNASKVLSKFMGDFLQNLYGVGIMHHYRESKTIKPICLGTTDGINTLMYAFMVHRILGKKPKIILDLSKNNEILLYNLNDYFTISSTPTAQSGPQVRSVGKTTVQQPKQKTIRANQNLQQKRKRLNTIFEENSVQKKNWPKPLPQKGKNRNDSTLGLQLQKRYAIIKNIIKQNKIKKTVINQKKRNRLRKKNTWPKPQPQKGKNRNDSTLGLQPQKRYAKIKNIIKQ